MPDMQTCGELADFLATQPRDRLVVVSSDAEGNSFSPLADADEAMFSSSPHTPWFGEIHPTPERLAELISTGTGAWDEQDDAAPEDAKRVVVLGPMN